MKKFAVVTCLWKRPHLTKAFLDWTHDLADDCNGFDVDLIAVGSEGDATETLAALTGWHYVEHPNEPLSEKWQRGVDVALARGADAVMLLGSDDFCTVEILRSAAKAIFEDGDDVFGLTDFRFLGNGPRAVWWSGYSEASGRVGEPMGAGRTFSRALLRRLRGKLWTESLAKGLDGAAWKRVQAAAAFFDDDAEPITCTTLPTMATGGMIIDVKRDGDEHICQFQDYLDTGSEEVDWRPIYERFPKWVTSAWDLDAHARFVERNFQVAVTGNPKTTLVMIAKDSEATIERAIRSALPVVDSITCVLDERGKGHEAAILLNFGADYTTADWQGFATQRNRAHARAEGDWHLILDADETLEPGNLAAALEHAHKKEEIDAILVTVYAWSRAGEFVPSMQPRLVRRGRAKWAFRRHNEMIGLEKTIRSSAVIRNSYVGRMDAIADASIVDLLAMYESPSDPLATPDEERAHAALHLARAYIVKRDAQEARKWARRVREHQDEGHLRSAWSVALECWATLMADGPDVAENVARRWIEIYPNFAELHYLVGSINMAKWYGALLNPGRYALIPQASTRYMGAFPRASAAMGFPVQVTTEQA